MNQKLDVLFIMHNMSSPNTLTEVSYQVMAITARDFLGLLPPQVVNKILCSLDGQSLARCARVSQKWRSLVIDKTSLWMRILKQFLGSHGDLVVQALKTLTPYQLYMRLRRKAYLIKSGMDAKLEFLSIAEFSHNPKLTSVKNIQSTPSGKLVTSYSVKQPQDFFQKHDVSTGCTSKILATLKTNYVVDFITTDLFLFSSSISGEWQCNVWDSGEEVFKINTKEYGINNRWFSSFASPCTKCPLLAIFDTNKICTPNGGESFCPIKIITSFVHEEQESQFGIKHANFVCAAKPDCNALVNNAIVSCSDANNSSPLLPCDNHKVILQQQDFQIFIYKVNTQPTLLAHGDLNPELLCHLKPTICPDIPQYIFDCYKFCLSQDQKLIGFMCGSEFIYWNLENDECRRLMISGGYNNLMLLGIGNAFTLVAEVKTLVSIQPILILTGTGEIIKVLPVLKPSETDTNDQLYNFLTAPVHSSWLSSDDIDDVVTVFAALYNGGKVFCTWSLVCNSY